MCEEFLPCAQGIIFTKSIVYGNVARYFGKKREEDGHTHSWTCYLRPFKNEVINMSYDYIYPNCVYIQDMSVYIRKVQFKLHESYPNPTRGNHHNLSLGG